MNKTLIKKVDVDWRDIKNECRNTSNKNDTSVPASKEFIKKILISEHSPIRMGKIRWRWEGIKSWISVHFVRHHIGVEKWVSTQRTDRTNVDRDKSTQDTPVNMEMEANAQALINMAKVRLCRQASKETREYMEDLKISIKDVGQEEISNVMVPSCIFRCGCSEFEDCGFFKGFRNWIEKNNIEIDWFDIQSRYDAYNKFFYETKRGE